MHLLLVANLQNFYSYLTKKLSAIVDTKFMLEEIKKKYHNKSFLKLLLLKIN
jgi:hypothetical protein